MFWLSNYSERKEWREAARLAVFVLQNAGVTFSDELLDSLSPLPKVNATQALLELQEQANTQLSGVPVTLGMMLPAERKRGGAIAQVQHSAKPKYATLVWFWGSLIATLERPPRHIRRCPQCGEIFKPSRSDAVFDTDVCRAKFNATQAT